ncbi:aldehyde dehydrogenase family protein [Nocardioides yefusunii]|uniref:aldehyde dehydrogenase (NAD(+)) n=1 Tax=Nocardioides yefusunii TaxID=2500546 RepID=A0ABW1R382_9ACTN|nr:aldehyde dehydrogenase family protein [Nocardioides yefusunii]
MSEVQNRSQIYVDGAWRDSAGTGRIEVLNPATEQVIAEVSAGDAADVQAAVAAARAAQPAWAALSGAERGDFLGRIAKEIEAEFADLTAVAVADVGMPVDVAGPIQVGVPLFQFSNFAQLAATLDEPPQEVGPSLVVEEPVGVVGAITPWNFPFFQVSLKVGAALAAGCTIVLKPSEVAPLLAYRLADVVDRIGLPAGVFNLVSGGPEVGAALSSHPDVDLLSFTGSTATGKKIAVAAAENTTRVALELGGKSATIVLDDADLQSAVADALGKCFLNSGQICIAQSRLLVPASKVAEVEALVQAIAPAFTPGDPTQSGVVTGPLVSQAQREKVLAHVERAVADGARVVVGGTPAPQETGFYVTPTVLTDVSPDSAIAQEEVFGPVLVILPYETDDDAVAIANNSAYGLSGGVWSADTDRALAVAKRLQTGMVNINSGQYNPAAPYGGYKASGYGREGGVEGLKEFLQTKTINYPAPAEG